MKKLVLPLCLILLISILGINIRQTANAQVQNLQDYTISSFSAVYNLTKDSKNVSQLQVDEYITAQFPEYDQNHGILRALPLTYNKSNLDVNVAKIDNAQNSLSPATQEWPYTTSKSNGNLVLKIGSANSYVHGVQNFHIAYQMQNVIKFVDNQDEFYWNVNGTQWQQPINQTSAIIIMPKDIASAMTEHICFTGAQGSKAQDCNIQLNQLTNGNTQVIVKSNSALSAGENLSFDIAFRSGTFTQAKPSIWQLIGQYMPYILMAGMPLITLLIVINKWRKYGRDARVRGTIIAQYDPPQKTSLLVNDFVVKESSRPLAITAQIINLAIDGYIRIIDDPEDSSSKKHVFSLELIKAPTDLKPEEATVVKMLFGVSPSLNTTIDLDSLKNKLSKQTKALASDLSQIVTKDGYFVTDPSKSTKKYIMYGSLCLIVGFLCFVFGSSIFMIMGLGIGLIISGIILFIVSKAMPARTLSGVELNDYLLGLKLYIDMAEQDRIRFHDSPDSAERRRINPNNPKQMIHIFESLLPYAMLFGMEKQWGKQFEAINTTPPDWYVGNWAAFNTGYLIGSLGDFNTSSIASYAPPSSNGSSGFGGGGFSGGGGGGGGGGGW